jgi:hypothetical protein
LKRTVWGTSDPRTLRALWALSELGLEYDHRKILPRGSGMEDSRFRALSERHKVSMASNDPSKATMDRTSIDPDADRNVELWGHSVSHVQPSPER